MSAIPADHARRAYDEFADAYDVFTAEHRYEDWTATLERLAVHHGLCGKRLLDVACGTGKSFIPFLGRGYEVTACDVSEAMVRHARVKARASARLEIHDMRILPHLGEFDLVCCLDDALNYLLEPRELQATFTRLAANLAPDGVLIFDVNSVLSYRRFFGALSVVQAEKVVVVLDGQVTEEFGAGHSATAVTEVLSKEGADWTRRRVSHHQRHHPRNRIEAALSAAGLCAAGVYGLHLDGSVDPDFDELENSKAVYVVRRSGSV